MIDIHWRLTVDVPQLETLNGLMEKLVDYVQSIKDEVTRLVAGQAEQTEALATQLEAIVAEMQQFTAGNITQEQLDNLYNAIKSTADTAHQQAADIKANTEKIMQIVPDEPPA